MTLGGEEEGRGYSTMLNDGDTSKEYLFAFVDRVLGTDGQPNEQHVGQAPSLHEATHFQSPPPSSGAYGGAAGAGGQPPSWQGATSYPHPPPPSSGAYGGAAGAGGQPPSWQGATSYPHPPPPSSGADGGAAGGGGQPQAWQGATSYHQPPPPSSGADGVAAAAGGPANTPTLEYTTPTSPSPSQRTQEALGDPPHMWTSGVRLIPEDKINEIKWYPAQSELDADDKFAGQAKYWLKHEYCTQRLRVQSFGFEAIIRFVCGSVIHEDPKTKKLTDSAEHLDNTSSDPSNTWHKYVRGTSPFDNYFNSLKAPLHEAYYMFLPRKSGTAGKAKNMPLEDYVLYDKKTHYCLATYIEIDQGNCAESSANTGPCYLGLWWGALQSAFCNPDDHRRGTVGIVDKFWNSLKQLKGIMSQSSGGAASQEPVEGAAPLCQCKAREFRGKLDKGIHFLWDLQHHPSTEDMVDKILAFLHGNADACKALGIQNHPLPSEAVRKVAEALDDPNFKKYFLAFGGSFVGAQNIEEEGKKIVGYLVRLESININLSTPSDENCGFVLLHLIDDTFKSTLANNSNARSIFKNTLNVEWKRELVKSLIQCARADRQDEEKHFRRVGCRLMMIELCFILDAKGCFGQPGVAANPNISLEKIASGCFLIKACLSSEQTVNAIRHWLTHHIEDAAIFFRRWRISHVALPPLLPSSSLGNHTIVTIPAWVWNKELVDEVSTLSAMEVESTHELNPVSSSFRSFEDARTYVRTLGLKSKEEWEEWRKSGNRPPDIPGNPQTMYKSSGWTSYGDFLGYAEGQGARGSFRTFEDARVYVRTLGLKSREEWNAWRKSGARPHDIPSSPHTTYKSSGWLSYPDFLGYAVGKVAGSFRTFEDARAYVRTLGLKSVEEWNAWSSSGARPHDIPSNPQTTYKSSGWTSLGDFLGYAVGKVSRSYRTFEDARVYVRTLGLKSYREWNAWSASGARPHDIPRAPDVMYASSGWTSFGDFLGYAEGKVTGSFRSFEGARTYGDFLGFADGKVAGSFRTFEDARAYVRTLGLKSVEEWNAWSSSGKRPLDIPSNPNVTYKSSGWISYGDFLGYAEGKMANSFRSFEDARAYVRLLGLKSQNDWQAWSKSGARPHDIPSAPNVTYKSSGWTSWGDFLAYAGGKVTGSFRSFEDARTYVRTLGLKSVAEWKAWSSSGARPHDIPSAPDTTYKSSGWTSLGDFLGYAEGKVANTLKRKVRA